MDTDNKIDRRDTKNTQPQTKAEQKALKWRNLRSKVACVLLRLLVC